MRKRKRVGGKKKIVAAHVKVEWFEKDTGLVSAFFLPLTIQALLGILDNT